MSRAVALVGLGFPQLGLVRAARALGLRVVGLDLNPNAVAAPLVDEVVVASTGDADAVAHAVTSRGLGAVTTTGSELALTTTAEVTARLGLPFYADRATIHRCQDKGAMRAAYVAAGLAVPRFFACRALAEARAFVAEVGLPLVVKPARGWGQRGVSRVDDASQLPQAFERASAVSHGGAGVVLEEHVSGPEVSVNGWVTGGALEAFGVTLREVFAGTEPLGVMRSEIIPSGLGEASDAAAVDAAARAARALGLVRGPCYTQVCMSARGPVVFETAARCGGGFDADVTRLVSGVDLYRRLLGVALGDEALEREGPRTERHGAALVRFFPPPRGTVREVRGLDAARALPGVVDLEVYARPGEAREGLVNAASRAGHALVVADDRASLLARADAAEQRVEIAV